ncbi:hypothetical protein ACJJTC_016969 [Scirpophaga incertulas]
MINSDESIRFQDSAVVSPIEVEPTNDEIEVQAIHTPPIDKELKNELMTKHVAFENISMLPPKLNPEKVAAVSEPVKKRDLIIAERQKQVGAALAALGMSLQLFLQNGERIEILKNINDAAKILCNTCYSDTMNRRSLISAVIKKDMKESLTGDTVFCLEVTSQKKLRSQKLFRNLLKISELMLLINLQLPPKPSL